MKKFFILALLFCSLGVFALTPIYVSHYQDGIGDEVQVSLSPIDGNLYMIVNGCINLVFSPAGLDANKNSYWHNPTFGDLVFTPDYKFLQIHEYSSGKIISFRYVGIHTEYLN